ncbi:hypothetical protein BGX34_010708 [Mortierella sp. NVP85]|nr:hypothetical protein BGX34_010708 [Mortierella sp. NVP85]
MSYLLQSSFHYTADVVDFDAMNITETFPEANSLSFDMSVSYNHSYSDSISGIPLAQQALWDDGQLSVPQTVNSSRILPGPSALSSLNNSANNSINYGHPSTRHLSVPQQHYGRHLHHHMQGSPLKAHPECSEENTSGGNSMDDFDESSIHNGWVDETKDHNGLMLLNDKDHQDEQHLLFLQDIGSAANISRGDSISLFAKLADESDLSCDLFKEEFNADETRDHSRVEQHPGSVDAAGNPLGQVNGMLPRGKNEIFSQEFMAALRAPLITTTPPQLESSKGRNLLEGLHVVPPVANVSLTEEEIRNIVRNSQQQKQQQQQQQEEKLQEMANDAKKEKTPEEKARDKEIYQAARKSFLDSLKMADPIKTPHKFAPLPLPIMWNDPKIRSRALPSFELSDYREKPKPLSIPIKLTPKNVDASNNNGALPPRPPSASALSSSPSQTLYSTSPTPTLPPPQSMATTTTTTITTTITTTTMPSSVPAEAAGINSSKRDSISSSPTKMHSILNSMHSSLSSFATSPPTITTATDAMSRMAMTPQTPTAAGFANGPDTPQPAQQLQQQQQQLQLQQQLFKEQQEQQQQQEKKQELSPPPVDRPRRHSSIQNPHLAFDPTITPEEREAKSAKNTLERRSTLQQAVRAKFQVDSDQETTNGDDQGGSLRRSLRSTSARKRRSLHQDLFVQEQPPSDSKDASVDSGQDAGVANDEARLQPLHQDEGVRSRRGSRPLSANILPESLTSYNNHPSYQDKEKKKMDEDEEGSPTTATAPASATTTTSAATSPTALRPPGTLSLGRATGPRYARSGSNSSATSGGAQQQQISPTTPTTVHPYATLSGRTPRPQQPGSARSSLSGISGGMHTPGTRTSQQFHQQPLDDDAGAGPDEHEVPPTLSRLTTSQPASRSESKLLSPGQRRSGLYAPAPPAAAQDREIDTSRSHQREIDTSRSHQQNPRLSFSSSPPTERYEDHYRPESREEHHQVPSRRNSYLRQRATSGDRDRETPDWQGDDDEDHLPRRYSLQRPSLRDAAMTLRRASTEFQKESLDVRGHVRSRTQDLYSRSSGYGDFDTEFDDEYPRGLTRRTSSSSNASALTARFSPQSPMKDMKDYFSSTGRSGSGSGGLTSPPVPVPSSAGSRFSDHHRRLSRDGLMPTQRVSPPPSASATTAHHRLSSSSSLSGLSGPNGSSGVPPRRSVSNVTGSSIIPPATVTNTRRLSISGGSGSGYGHGRSASSSSLTGLGVNTTGAGAYGAGPKAGMYSAGALDRYSMSDRRGLSISESSGHHFTPPPRVVPHRGSNSSTGSGSGSRASSMSMGMGSSEYTRGVAPSRASTGGLGYGGHSASSRSQQYADDYDSYDFRPDVPIRHSSLGGTAIGRGSLRNSVQSVSSGPLPTSSQLRRATSTTLNKGGPGSGIGGGAYGGAGGYGGNGTASLGRNSGGNMMGGRQYQQPPPSYQRGGYI